ncbi:MAG: hypothetical protein U9Q92_00290 [archaeon]|nr:hypothetical protein [archaeon]
MLNPFKKKENLQYNNITTNPRLVSADYKTYRKDEKLRIESTFFEKMCFLSGKLIQLKFGKKMQDSLEKSIRVGRLSVNPEDVGALLLVSLGLMTLILLPLSLFYFEGSMRFGIWVFPVAWSYYVLTYPAFRAQVVKIQAADESLKVVLYMAMYLELNPNLENAVKFAAEHIEGPLENDLSKMLWDLEFGVYTDVRQALGNYMQLWLDWNVEFVKSLELLIDSLSRAGDDRKKLLDKSLTYILDNSYANMRDYSRALENPIKIIQAMGILLPLMGLIMFPMVSIFLSGESQIVDPMFIGVGYTIMLPMILFFLMRRILLRRPGAFAFPSLKNARNLPPDNVFPINIGKKHIYLHLKITAILVAIIFMIPGLIQLYSYDQRVQQIDNICHSEKMCFRDRWATFMEEQYDPKVVFNNMLQVMTIIWGIALGIIIFCYGRSAKKQKLRQEITEIERDLFIGLTELENSLSRGTPIERSIYHVLGEYERMRMKESPLFQFFMDVLNNMQKIGDTFTNAVFDKNHGSILKYPSILLRNVMKMIVDAIPRGSEVITQNISIITRYIVNTRKVEELIKDLLEQVASTMKVMASFIAPLISAVCVAMAALIVQMLEKISQKMEELDKDMSTGDGGMSETLNMVNMKNIMPPTMLLLIVGIYLIELVVLLSYFANGIEHGFDQINRDMLTVKNMAIAMLLFSGLVLVSLGLFGSFIYTLD